MDITLTIKVEADDGETLVKVYVNGEAKSFNHHLSRILTKTTYESGTGIFTECPEDCSFFKGDSKVVVDLVEPWDPAGKSSSEILDDILQRIAKVKEAFEISF